MDENEILSRFGIGKNLAYGLFIQSILVIIGAILALNTLQWNFFNGQMGFEYISAILLFLTCVSLIIYSFFEYTKNKQYFFTIAIILVIINNIIWAISLAGQINFDYYLPQTILSVILHAFEALIYIYFLRGFNKNYNDAKYAILLAVLLEILGNVIWCAVGIWPWYAAVPYLIISGSIVLTYFERAQRGKYLKLK